MDIRDIVSTAIATVLLASGVPALAQDLGDHGRLPRPDHSRDAPPSSSGATSTTTAAATAAEQDKRDPGHAVVTNEKLRDTVRRR